MRAVVLDGGAVFPETSGTPTANKERRHDLGNLVELTAGFVVIQRDGIPA
jgi:hypothetical protein